MLGFVGVLDDDRRFMVVVAQFDKTYQYDKHWAKEEIQKMVCKEIKLQTGKDIQVSVVLVWLHIISFSFSKKEV